MGLIYKQQGLISRSRQSFAECIEIRKNALGSKSVLVAKALEELGKLNLEESLFVESFANLKESYGIFNGLANCEEEAERI